MSWRDQPLYVVEWACGPDLPYTRKIYSSFTWAKKYLFNYMQKNQAEGYITLHQPHGAGSMLAIARQKDNGPIEVEVFEDDQVIDGDAFFVFDDAGEVVDVDTKFLWKEEA